MNILVGYKSRFIIKTLLPTLLTMSLFITSFFIVLIPQFEDIIYGRKREMIRELTNSAWSILEHWSHREMSGEVSQQNAQESAIEQIEQLRYGEEGKDYFWITDHAPDMIMHPYRSDLNGKSLSDFRDSDGKRLFVEMVTTVESSKEGYVHYTWQWKDDSSRIVPKLSFVKGFTPWKWIIGTGIYIEDVKAEIASLERQILTISIGITVLISLMLLYIAFQNLRAETQRQQAELELHESREKYRALVEASTEGLIMVLADHEVFYNKTLFGILGYTDGFPSGLTFRNLLVTIPRTETFDFELFKPVDGRELKIEQVETKIRTKSGEVLDIFISISPITLLEKDGIILSVKDISRNRQIEDALDSSQEKYHALTNQLSIGVFRIAPTKEGKFLEVNPAAGTILGAVEKDGLLTYTLLDLFVDDQEGRKFFDSLYAKGKVRNWVAALRPLTGPKAIISLSAILIRDKQGRPMACDGILEDITQQKHTESDRENLISDLQNSMALLHQSIKSCIKSYPMCTAQSTIGNAIQLMTQNHRDAVLVTTDGSMEIGIITEHDIQDYVLAHQKDINDPVHSIKSPDLISLPSTASVMDVLQVFIEKTISHVVILGPDHTPLGIVHAREIQKSLFTSYLSFLHRIDSIDTILQLKEYHSRLLFFVQTLIEKGSPVADITRVTTMISNAFTKRLFSLASAEFGEPPVPFAFIGLGSEGRKEQTLLTDQDNACVYQDPPAELREKAEVYFLRLGEWICGGLDAVGYQYCKGGIMAKNTNWCQPLSVWKKYFTEWVTNANPQNILDVKIFFDFRLLYGSEEIEKSLRSHVKKVLTGNDPFFLYLSESVLHWELPDGVQKLKSPFDIKKVLMPLVDSARLYALKHQVAATNTMERLTLLFEAGIFSRKWYQEMTDLYSFLLRKRFQHQAKLVSENMPPSNEIDPEECSEFDVLFLKKAVAQIETLKGKISLDFKGISNR